MPNNEESDESWIKEPVYGVESVTINAKTMECDAHYSLEKFMGNKADAGAPPVGKMRVQLLGMGVGVVFSDGSKAKNDVNNILVLHMQKVKFKNSTIIMNL
jgi:hypothetical protein